MYFLPCVRSLQSMSGCVCNGSTSVRALTQYGTSHAHTQTAVSTGRSFPSRLHALATHNLTL